ncbi:glucan endo-1,3-beta-glucosidase 8-like [Triticum dicoccoides]|uniref:glucan endo-1,3-beta-glucosidase 8-like n=1 Tax=Triticum dicoccoides TaxID=85692 RepID=UPI00188F5F14|nr:glucan endo-1,3-beta-glucosidase 8-like [Triticum dicoccoides]
MARLEAAALLLAAAAAALLATAAEGLGVNWGTQASHPLPPKVVVQLLKDNGINKVKLFETNPEAMKALAGSGVEVMLAIPNDMLHRIAGDSAAARDWVKRNVKRFDFDGGVVIKYVAVGNEPFLAAYKGSFMKVTLPALENIQNALNDAGVGDRIKATVPLNADVYNSPARNPVPSAGRFRAEISGVMTDMVKFLAKNKAPFTVNIYPFLSLYLDDNFPLDFAFFDGGATPVNDNGVMYTNVYDANFDTLVAALAAVGHGDMPIIVGEVGWPTDGDRHAKASYARRFYDGLLKRLAANRGTPARPNRHIETYLFGVVDEDRKSVQPGSFERHWGIFRYDGQPKFAMDLSGQGRNTMLVPVKGVQYLSRTWCALNPKASRDDLNKLLGAKIDYACSNADCTTLGYGSSCNGMDARGNASYAFNAYYQTQSQEDEACDFQGLALPTQTDPSTATCNFTIQIATSGAAAATQLGVAPAAAALLVALLQLSLL